MDFPESDARVPLEFLGRGLRLFLIVGGASITAFFVLGGVLAAFHRLSPGDGNGVGGAIGYPTFGGLIGLLCWYLLRYRSGEILLSDESLEIRNPAFKDPVVISRSNIVDVQRRRFGEQVRPPTFGPPIVDATLSFVNCVLTLGEAVPLGRLRISKPKGYRKYNTRVSAIRLRLRNPLEDSIRLGDWAHIPYAQGLHNFELDDKAAAVLGHVKRRLVVPIAGFAVLLTATLFVHRQPVRRIAATVDDIYLVVAFVVTSRYVQRYIRRQWSEP